MSGNVSNDLIWQITRTQSRFLVKRPAAGGVELSSEPQNLVNRQSYKYSGIANDKAVGVELVDGHIVVTTKKAGQFNMPASSLIVTKFKPHKTNRKAYKAVAQITKGYRDDIRKDAVARTSRLLKATRPAKSSKNVSRRAAKVQA